MWRKAAIVYKGDDNSTEMAQYAAEFLRGQGLEIWSESSGADDRPEPPKDFAPDLVISLGGDGTILHAARAWGLTGAPIVGVNFGHLGFLAEIEPDQFTQILADIINDHFQLEKRLALEARVEREGKIIAKTLALNEVVVNKGALSRIISLTVKAQDIGQWSFRADGVIIATPTGSTAYNISAGGPVIYPTIPAIIVTPICPFTLTSRPIVLPADFNLEIVIEDQYRDLQLTTDGQINLPLRPGDRITVAKHQESINLIVNPRRNFIGVLRQKLNWG